MSRTPRTTTLCVGVSVSIGGVIWTLTPPAGEIALYEAGQVCGVAESFLYYIDERKNAGGKVEAIDYATDGTSSDFACVDRELNRRGTRHTIIQAIDNA